MIQKLRRRFVLITTTCLAVALTIIIAAINIGQYVSSTTQADELIQLIHDNGYELPYSLNHPEFSPETAYETRYFVAHLNSKGQVYLINTNHVAALDQNSALSKIQEIRASGHSSGYSGNYRYGVYDNIYSQSIVVLDCYSRLANTRILLKMTLLTALGLLATVFLIVVFASRRVVHPFVENYKKQQRFITDAGHELKTPITVISANTDVLEMTEGKSEWTQSIRDQVARMSRLVQNLIELSRMEELSQTDIAETFDLSEAVSQSLLSFQALANQKGLGLEASLTPNLHYTGIQDEILRLIGILMDNAMKYADPGSIVHVGLQEQKRRRVLTVENTCTQLSPASLPHLFERFYRADQSRSRHTGGYGIGLSIAEAITRRHKGKITATYKNNRVIFTVEL